MLRERSTHGRFYYEFIELTLNKKGIAISQSLFYFFLILYATEQYYELRCEYP